MLSFFKKLKWVSPKHSKNNTNSSSIILGGIIGLIEDALFWKITWLSLAFMFIINILFLVCIHQQISFVGFTLCVSCALLIIDAFETWLKYKHRTAFLREIAYHSDNQLNSIASDFKTWIKKKSYDYIHLRATNQTKAFLLVNILLSSIFIIGLYVDIYFLTYLICMFVCVSHKLTPTITRLINKIHQNVESDGELEGLLPEISDVNMKLLSIEPDQVVNERQSLEYWKPYDLPIEEISDSSDNSSSLVTNLSIDKIHTLEKDSSDSSEDEYIPSVPQKEHLQSTLEEVQKPETWSSTAYNAFYSITGAVTNIMYKSKPNPHLKRSHVTRGNSSEGFEVIDENDLM